MLVELLNITSHANLLSSVQVVKVHGLYLIKIKVILCKGEITKQESTQCILNLMQAYNSKTRAITKINKIIK
jgi:hypothetical protein